jgi:prepilin signal peptidase PulO-like enzyme (type II secretory pathway)
MSAAPQAEGMGTPHPQPTRQNLFVRLISLVISGGLTVLELLSTDFGRVAARLGFLEQLIQSILALRVGKYPLFILHSDLWPIYLVFLIALLIISWYEWRGRIIPDLVTIPGIFVGLAMSILYGSRHIGLLNSLVGTVVGYATVELPRAYYRKLSGKEGMGFGVVKLTAMIGAFLGPVSVILTMVAASTIGTLYGVLVVLLNRVRHGVPFDWGREFEFGPFLAISGSLCAVLFPHVWYADELHKNAHWLSWVR